MLSSNGQSHSGPHHMVSASWLALTTVSCAELPAGMVFVRYFGTFEWGQMKPGNVVAFDKGLTAGLHGKWTKYKADFIKAMQHADVYLQASRACMSGHAFMQDFMFSSHPFVPHVPHAT